MRWLALALLWPGIASATTPEEDDPTASEDKISGSAPPPLPREPKPAQMDFQLPEGMTRAEFDNLPYPMVTYVGARVLHLDPQFVNGVQQGLELMYLRKYTEAKEHFGALETAFPGTAVQSVGDVMVWQALMLENFDYRYDKQYWTASKQARKDLEAAISTPGNDAWEQLMNAAIVGIESIHTMRQGNYLNALSLAFQAMESIEKCRAAAPEFVDLKLADGLYNYWRSVITMSSKILPDFGDHRVEGIEQMELVETQGIFVGPLATLSLAFTWMEENDLRRAGVACARNRSHYPDNIINNLVCGMVYINMRRYTDAVEVFDRVLAVDPANTRVHYFRGLAFLKQGMLEPAKTEFEGYLAASHLEPYQKSYANYRLGQVYSRLKQYPKAVEHFQAAVKIDGNKSAKNAIERLEERRKEGKIQY